MTEEKETVTNQVPEHSSIFTDIWQWLILDHLHLNHSNAKEVLFALQIVRVGCSYVCNATSRGLFLLQKYFLLVLSWHCNISQEVSQGSQYKRQSGFPSSERAVCCLKFWQRKEERKNSLQQWFTIRASAALFHGSYSARCKRWGHLKDWSR